MPESRACPLQRIGEGPELFGVMVGLWSFNLARNRLHDAMGLAEKIVNLSRLMNTELAEARAHSALGSTCVWRGEFGRARQHLEQAVAIYDQDVDRYLPMQQTSVVPSRCQLAWTLWMMGYSEQAHARAEEAIQLATRLGAPFSMAYALMYTIVLAHFRRDHSVIRPRAESLIQITQEHGFPYWSTVESVLFGRVLV